MVLPLQAKFNVTLMAGDIYCTPSMCLVPLLALSIQALI